MKQFHRQKGQGLVEFAIVLPIMILFLVGAYYIMMLSYDVMTLSTFARNSARQLAVCTTEADMSGTTRDTIIANHANANASLGNLYVWNPNSNAKNFEVIVPSANKEKDSEKKSVTVYMRASLRDPQSFASWFLPNAITAESTMYWERANSNS